jgi:hypothetical protein
MSIIAVPKFTSFCQLITHDLVLPIMINSNRGNSGTSVSTLSKLTEQGQVNAVAQTLYSSGILKEGKEATNQ